MGALFWALVGVVSTLIGIASSLITIGQYFGMLPQHASLTIPVLAASNRPDSWVWLAVGLILIGVGLVCWRGSTVVQSKSRGTRGIYRVGWTGGLNRLQTTTVRTTSLYTTKNIRTPQIVRLA